LVNSFNLTSFPFSGHAVCWLTLSRLWIAFYHIPFDSADTIFCFGAVLAVLAGSAGGFVIVPAFPAVPGLPLHPRELPLGQGTLLN